FKADVAPWKEALRGQEQRRQEGEDGRALQNIEQRNEHALRDAILGGPVTVDQRERQGQDIGQNTARQRVKRVPRQRPGRKIDGDRDPMLATPLTAQVPQAVKQTAQRQKDDEVHPAKAASAANHSRSAAPDPLSKRFALRLV